MKAFPSLVIVAGMFVSLLGLFFGLYVLLTRGRRRTMREIRTGAAAQGWRYRLRRWQGDPTAFRIDGQTASGLTWILKSGATGGYNRGWCVQLGLRFPTLAGRTDVSVMPRNSAGRAFPRLGVGGVPLRLQVRVAAFSEVAAGAVGFMEAARELPSGLSDFDATYQIMALPRIGHSPIDLGFAQRMLRWPADTIAPHSLLFWRDPFGIHLQARLRATPNWATIGYFLALGGDFCTRLPASEVQPISHRFVDRMLSLILRR